MDSNEPRGQNDSSSGSDAENNVSTNTAATEMIAQFLKATPSLSQLVVGCDHNSMSSVVSSGSSTSSDKTDNRETPADCSDSGDMRLEEERMKTFEKWPVSFISPQRLAQNGFYYIGRGDEVRCAFCKVEIMQWMEGDDPAADHQRWAPQCPFLRGQANAGSLPGDLSNDGHDECGSKARMTGPIHPNYASVAARRRTFADWPRSMRQKPEDLAEAGFFYTGQGDKTKCFYCDGGLKDWENHDVPWEQHARWFSRCAYVQLVKGKDYVQKVISKTCTKPAPKEGTNKPAESAAEVTNIESDQNSKVDDSKLCKICYVDERNVCFVPCGHVVACAKCALATDKCPMCRNVFTNAVRLYFS